MNEAQGSINKYISAAQVPTSSAYVLPKAPGMKIGGDVTNAEAVRVECQCSPPPCQVEPRGMILGSTLFVLLLGMAIGIAVGRRVKA